MRSWSLALVAFVVLSGCASVEPNGAPSSTTPPAATSSTTSTSSPPTAQSPSTPPVCVPPTSTATCDGSPPTSSTPAGPGPSDNTRRAFAGCSGSGPVTFNVSPMRQQDVAYLLPYGLLAGGHVTPIDHMYLEPADRALGRDVYEVRAIADGVIYTIQPRDAVNETGQPKGREWHVRFAHTCTFTSYFDLLTSLAPDLLATFNATGGVPQDGIPVKAGQLIGRIGAQTLDFGVYDYNVTLPGFLVPAHYTEDWKVHTVDPFPYFTDDVRAMLLSKMMRQAPPRAGKIDHDVDGRVIGNWFLVGAGGYGSGGSGAYWESHFAFVPDGLDPAHFLFSIGNWSGEPLQFAVKGNAPDPANISVETGLVRIELVRWEEYAHNDATHRGLGGPDRLQPGDDVYAINSQRVEGTALLQMMGPRLLKLETFPGKTADQVTGFDERARMYER